MSAADSTSRLMALALPEQTLLTRAAFDSARQSGRVHAPGDGAATPDGDGRAPDLGWPSHGPYRLKGTEDEPYEVCEVGVVGFAPLQRVVRPERAATYQPGAERSVAPGKV